LASVPSKESLYPFITLKTAKKFSMFAKIKQAFFTDSLTIEWATFSATPLKFVLKNDKGEICTTLEAQQEQHQKFFNWHGLNDLPYGSYILELSNTEGGQSVKLVKRV
jgi:hypothetical protein